MHEKQFSKQKNIMIKQHQKIAAGVISLAIIVLMSSCASILSGRKAKITLNSSSTTTKEVVTIKADGKTYVDVLPCKIKVKRGRKPSIVSISSEHSLYENLVIQKKFNHTVWWNIALGGIIGIGVDAATGAMYKPESKHFWINSTPKQQTNKEQAALTVPSTPSTGTSTNNLLETVPSTFVQKQTKEQTKSDMSPARPGIADVDTNIPCSNKKNNYIYAIIIANENYQTEEKVPFAQNDGRIFAEYCTKTLEIPERNIDLFCDASFNNIRKAVSNAKMFADIAGEKGQIIFYYAGHGVPDEKNRSAYLLPVDGDGTDISTGYKLDDLYKELSYLKIKNITVFIDACFSGSKRDGGKLTSARGIAIKVAPTAPKGNMIVFTASSGEETAYGYKEKSHGLFTYYLLKKLQESKGNVSYEELFNYIEENVKMTSFQTNRKPQTPTVATAPEYQRVWRNVRLKGY